MNQHTMNDPQEQTDLKCPACNKTLMWLPEAKILYCGYGPCHWMQSNDGASGATPQDAFAALKSMYDRLAIPPE